MIKRAQVGELYTAGKNIQQIMESLGATRKSVDHHLKRLGIACNPERKGINPEEVGALHAQGKTIKQMQAVIKHTKEAIDYHLRKLGLTPNYVRAPRRESEMGLLSGTLSYRRLRCRIIEKLGSKCVKCGFSDPRALQVDHINAGGTAYRQIASGHKQRMDILSGVGPRVQLLCANCNQIKKAENQEVCNRNPDGTFKEYTKRKLFAENQTTK